MINHYKFNAGDTLPLDAIYAIQGIGEKWWEFQNDDEATDTVIITRTINIDIKVSYNATTRKKGNDDE